MFWKSTSVVNNSIYQSSTYFLKWIVSIYSCLTYRKITSDMIGGHIWLYNVIFLLLKECKPSLNVFIISGSHWVRLSWTLFIPLSSDSPTFVSVRTSNVYPFEWLFNLFLLFEYARDVLLITHVASCLKRYIILQ